jgi:CheY-like chemotaxis protein
MRRARYVRGGWRWWLAGMAAGGEPPYARPVELRCVIVDDNPAFLRAARLLLEQEGLRIVGTASTAADALREVAELRPDVTLVDVDLGEDSGFDLASRLVADPAIEPGRIILISAHAEEDLADLIEASPAVGFVGKPTLSAAAIARLLDGASGGSAAPSRLPG